MMFKTRREKPEGMSREERIKQIVDEVMSRPRPSDIINNKVDPRFRDAARPVYKNQNRVQRWLDERAQRKTGFPKNGWIG